MIRLLLDQGLPRPAIDPLLDAGWDVVHACECGLAALIEGEESGTSTAFDFEAFIARKRPHSI